jgi:hypothetical protein
MCTIRRKGIPTVEWLPELDSRICPTTGNARSVERPRVILKRNDGLANKEV